MLPERARTKRLPLMQLVWPTAEFLERYIAALQRGWSPDTVMGDAAAQAQLRAIAADANGFVASLLDREATGGPIDLPDGTQAARLPGYFRWLWDGDFCGSIGLRWAKGTHALPPHCMGHIGFSVVPWKQRRGYATSALGQILLNAAAEGLDYVELTTDLDNTISQRVITANGGQQVEQFHKLACYGGGVALRYHIDISHLRAQHEGD